MSNPRMTPDEIKMVNATSRSGGAVGGMALVPKVVDTLLYEATRPMNVLDYGAGKTAYHTRNMRARHSHVGHSITAYDIGVNCVYGLHEEMAVLTPNRFDIVFASNCLNVLPHEQALVAVMDDVRFILKPGGVFICNYPASPRKSTMSPAHIENILSWGISGIWPTRIGGTASAPVWKVRKADF